MRKLETIQKRDKLNTVFAADDEGPGGANHIYMVECRSGDDPVKSDLNVAMICFQCGGRNEPSYDGCLCCIQAQQGSL